MVEPLPVDGDDGAAVAGGVVAGADARGPFVDGGAVFGSNPPPQTLFELGGDRTLSGYRYKEFAGDRAELVREKIGIRFLNCQARGHFVAAILLQLLTAGSQRLHQMKTFDAAAASFP